MPVVPKEALKAYFIRDKLFLRSLFEGPNSLKNRRLLLAASEGEIDTLIKFLHYLANGKIKITANNFDSLKKSRKLGYLRKTFESNESLTNLLTLDDATKRSILLKLANCFPYLLSPLFILPSKRSKHV